MAISLPYAIVNGTTADGTQMQANLTALLNGINGAAPLVSPIFTGVPSGPTAAPSSSTLQFATTAFVTAALVAYSSVVNTLLLPFAPLAAPALTGVPTTPLAAAQTNTGQIASTAFVQQERAPRIQAVVSAASVAPAFPNDQVNITAQAVALTLANPTGSALDGWGMAIRIKDSGVAQALAYGTQYRAVGVVLPTTTILSRTLYLGVIWNAADTFFDVVAVVQQ